MKLSEVIDLLRGPRKRGEAARLMGAHPCSLAKWDRQCVVIGGRIYKDTGLQLPPIDTELQAERHKAIRAVLSDSCTFGMQTARELGLNSPDKDVQLAAIALRGDSFNRYYLGLDIDGATRLSAAEWLAVISKADALNK